MIEEVAGAFELSVNIKRQRQVTELLQTQAALDQAREVMKAPRDAE